MAECNIKKIARPADNKQILDYLDYLAERLNINFGTIGEENLTDDLIKRIGGK